MRLLIKISIFSVILCASAVIFASEQKNSYEDKGALDFRQIISNAKKEVYPALIFVKPIVEEFSSGEKLQQEVFGSGVIISADGYAITNHHVIDKAISLNCVLHNKKQVPAKIIGFDKDTDLALLKLPDDANDLPYPYARFSGKELQEGDFVMAMGSPYGFQRSISLGVISNAQRYIGFQTEYKYNTWLQTDAAINPGNSGGPLIDTDGKIVGINTLGMEGSGIGFSIPAAVVQETAARLKKDGEVIRAYTGLRLQALRDFESSTFTEGDKGVLISGVEDNSPAAKANIVVGDILLQVNNRPTDGMYAEMLPTLWKLLADLPVDKEAKLKLLRKKAELDVTILPQKKGKLEGEDYDCHRWGMTVKEINKFRESQLYYMYGDGIYVRAVKYPGNADTADLRNRDVIIKIDNQAVKTVKDVQNIYDKIIKDEKREKKVVFEIKRDGLSKWIVLDYRKNYDEE